jgi:AraC-like DNA-binding protein
VERLASEVAYSRSAFAERFRTLVGESPMAYVAQTRLAVAATLLDHDGPALAEVARRTGFSSASSLSRAFKRQFGLSPGAYRARRPDEPALSATSRR